MNKIEAQFRKRIARSTAAAMLFVFWLALLALTTQADALLFEPNHSQQDGSLQEAEKLFAQAKQLMQAHKYGEGIPIAERTLSIYEKQLGLEHPQVGVVLYVLAVLYAGVNDYAKAESLALRALLVFEKTSGAESADVVVVLKDLAVLYYTKSEYGKAESLYLRVLTIQKKLLGKEHPEVAVSLKNLAMVYQAMREYGKAESFYQQIMAMQDKQSDDLPLDLAQVVNNLGWISEYKGDYGKAEGLYLQALAIGEKRLGTEHPTTLTTRNNLATLYMTKGEYEKAEPLYLRALADREKFLGVTHPDVATSLNNLAEMYRSKGDYGKAEPLYLRAIAIFEKALGSEHPNVSTLLGNLALLYDNRGEYAKAESFYLRALAMAEKTLGAQHPDVANRLNGLANLYRDRGNYAKAELLFQRALSIREKTLGAEHPDMSYALAGLALLYAQKGDIAKAELFFNRALAISEKVFGAQHPNVALLLNNVAEMYRRNGDYTKAEALYLRALAIEEKTFGAEHRDVAGIRINLATLYRLAGDYTKAEPLYLRALASREKLLGAQHPDVAFSINALAEMYATTGNYAKAEPLFLQALAIDEKALGAIHPQVILILNNLAFLYLSKGDIGRALAFTMRANERREREMRVTLAGGSERQRLAYLNASRSDLFRTISLHVNFAPDNADAQRLALTAVLQYKGRALDAWADTIAVLRRRASSEDLNLLEQVASLRAQYAALIVRGMEKEGQEYHANLQSLGLQIDELENQISQRSLELRAQLAPLTLEDVQKAVPANAALVEFFVYYPFRAKTTASEKSFGEPRFVAYVLPNRGASSWVELGDAKTIEEKVSALRLALRDKTNPYVQRLARELDALVMQPVRRLLGTTRRVLLSPDGALNLVPFAALVDEQNEYLVKRYSFTYLTSGRDLLRLQTHIPGKSTKLIIADPDFGERQTLPDNTANRNAFADFYFEPLKATEAEARDLQQLFPDATVLVKKQATKAALKDADRPALLHIATHGFFLNDEELLDTQVEGDNTRLVVRRRKTQAQQVSDNTPLIELLARSGLAFAGANQRGSSEGNDGILTASEATGLDLWGTKLVVLSACDTGVGKTTSGEGVYGLRRALVLAGSESQMMSLWAVSDTGTRELMLAYYKRLQAGEGRSEALRQVQLEMLANPQRQHPFYWASFIQSGEWANLDGKRID